MPVYEYVGFDKKGAEVSGVVSSSSPRDARVQLREMSIRASSIKESKEKKGFSLKNLFRRKNMMELSNVTRQLATMMKSGIPITESLNVLIHQIEDVNLEKTFRQILDEIVQGASLAESMSKHSFYFSELYIAMVKAGEASGKLDEVLERLAEYIYKKQVIEEKIKATMAYPIILLMVGVVVVFVLLIGILPRITSFLEKSGTPLPLLTKFFIGLSDFLSSLPGLLMYVAIGVIIYLFKKYINTHNGRLWYDRKLLELPILGDLLKKSAVSKFSVTFATLLRTGIPALEGLNVVGKVLGNEVLKEVIDKVQKAVVEGSDMSTPLKESGIFPPVVGYMMAIGEQSGRLEELLERITESYDKEIEIASNKLIAVIEPIMILFLAGTVGTIIMAVMLPILQMSNIKH